MTLSGGNISNSSASSNSIGGVTLSGGNISNASTTSNNIGGVTLSGGTVVAPSTSNSTITLSGLPSLAYNTATGAFVQRGFGQIIAYGSVNNTEGMFLFQRGGSLSNVGAIYTFTFTTALPDANFIITYGGAQNVTFYTTGRTRSGFTFTNSANSSTIILDFAVVY